MYIYWRVKLESPSRMQKQIVWKKNNFLESIVDTLKKIMSIEIFQGSRAEKKRLGDNLEKSLGKSLEKGLWKNLRKNLVKSHA